MFIKRVFDILFSLLLTLFFLSWFVPLVAIVVVLEGLNVKVVEERKKEEQA